MTASNSVRRLAAVAGLALLATTARAAEGTRTGSGGPPAEYVQYLKMRPMEAMHMMDSGGKGYVEREEFVRFHQELFDRMDKNHDGRLTPDEWLGRPPKPDDHK